MKTRVRNLWAKFTVKVLRIPAPKGVEPLVERVLWRLQKQRDKAWADGDILAAAVKGYLQHKDEERLSKALDTYYQER